MLAETLVSPHSSVAALRLDFNKIGTRAAVAVAAAVASPEVAVANLSLFDTAVGVAGAVALADAATANPESSLNLLHLGQNGLGDAAAIVLAKTIAAPNRRITSLDLCNNSIGDTGALALAEAIVAASAGSDGRPGRLKELNMGGNAITDVGAAALAKTLGVPNGTLVSLRLENNQVADGDILGSIDVVPAVRKVKKKGELLLNAKSVSPPFSPPLATVGLRSSQPPSIPGAAADSGSSSSGSTASPTKGSAHWSRRCEAQSPGRWSWICDRTRSATVAQSRWPSS